MELTISPSRSGMPTCAAFGIWLHSRYDPEREARRIAVAEIGSSHPSHVLVLGPCLDYLSLVLREILPGARILSVQYSALFSGLSRGRPDAEWDPGSGINLESFLDATLDEDAISGVAVLEWEPATQAFPEEALAARKAARASLDRLASSAATVKVSGKRWITNACASFLLAERCLMPRKSTTPVLVAAAGPSLGSSIRDISRLRDRLIVITVSSALSACRASGLEPDLVLSTDGGYWSRHHLYNLAVRPLPLAAPLTALPSASIYGHASILLLDQSSFVERELLPVMGPSLTVPPHGTVSGTAIHVALRMSDGPIIVAGLDLASYGDLEHARPHAFDAFLSASVSRLAPLEGSAWWRSSESSPLVLEEKPWRSSRSLMAYASALALDARPYTGRLFRLGPSPLPIQGLLPIDYHGIEELCGDTPRWSEPLFIEEGLPDRGWRESFLSDRLAAWKSLASGAAGDMIEGRLPDKPLVAELLRSIDIVDYAAARRAILAGGEPLSAARDMERSCDSFLSGLQRRFAL
jgi:hypothetical protein